MDAKTVALVYVGIGLALSVKAAPVSWRELLAGKGVGNVPFWTLAWPIPVAAQTIKEVTGEFPGWTPDL